MAKIIITRKKAFGGAAQSHDVYLLNKKIGTLKNGGTLEFSVDPAIHPLYFQANQKFSKNTNFSVVVNEPTEVVNITAKIDMNGNLAVGYADNAPHIPIADIQPQSDISTQKQVQANNNSGMRCPKCQSNNLQIVSDVKGKGASATKICLCGICGLAGTGKTTTTHYWVCQNCGNKFKA